MTAVGAATRVATKTNTVRRRRRRRRRRKAVGGTAAVQAVDTERRTIDIIATSTRIDMIAKTKTVIDIVTNMIVTNMIVTNLITKRNRPRNQVRRLPNQANLYHPHPNHRRAHLVPNRLLLRRKVAKANAIWAKNETMHAIVVSMSTKAKIRGAVNGKSMKQTKDANTITILRRASRVGTFRHLIWRPKSKRRRNKSIFCAVYCLSSCGLSKHM